VKLTNHLGLPQAIVDAVANDSYNSGECDISITGLIAPPRIRVLKKQYEDLLEEDVSDRIYSLLGQVMHGVLERANKHALAEKRFFMDVEGPHGTWRISGSMDAVYEDGLIQDYKLMSYHKVSDGVPPDYEEQVNLYSVLLKYGRDQDGKSLADLVGREVAIKRLQLVCIFRDWSKGKAAQNDLMPQQQGLVLDVPRWSDKDALAFLKERVAAHQEAEHNLPLCSDEDRWKRPDKWAAMARKGAPRALKLYDKQEDAEAHVKKLGGTARVEPRPGMPVRCKDWCAVSKWCSQYQDELTDEDE
jgi:hypothetical protein